MEGNATNNTSADCIGSHDSKRVSVEVYDYVDVNVRMLARMYERRLKGYSDMGYTVTTASQYQLGI